MFDNCSSETINELYTELALKKKPLIAIGISRLAKRASILYLFEYIKNEVK